MRKILLLFLLSATACPLSYAGDNWAVVNLSCNFMREEPDYAAENGDQALMGTVVEVFEKSGYWQKIRTGEPYTAWTTDMGLTYMNEKEKDAYIAAAKLICTADFTHVLEQPRAKAARVCDLVMGDLLIDTGIKKGSWHKVRLPSGKEGWIQSCEAADFAEWAATREVTGDNVEAIARKFMGVPYMWGGTSIKNVDCSGLSSSVFRMLGVLLPRNASQQAKVGEEVTREQARKGDLVFFGRSASDGKPERITHVGIYIGDGRIIHSSMVVRENSLIPGTANYYGGNILHFRRIIGHVDDGTGITSILKSPYYFPQQPAAPHKP